MGRAPTNVLGRTLPSHIRRGETPALVTLLLGSATPK